MVYCTVTDDWTKIGQLLYQQVALVGACGKVDHGALRCLSLCIQSLLLRRNEKRTIVGLLSYSPIIMVFPSIPLYGIPKLHELLKVVSRLEKGSGFSASLGLSHSYFSGLSRDQLHFDSVTNTLTSRVSLNDRLFLPVHSLSSSVASLSTFQAMMDDLTTWALVLADPKHGRAGVSVCLKSEWGRNQRSRLLVPGIEQVDIIASVSKVGKNLGFVEAVVRDLDGDLLCYGSHIKFLPMGLVLDFLQSSRGWTIAKLIAEYVLEGPTPANSVAPPLSQLFDSLEFIADNRATFSVTPSHSSLGGPIHGGCQAVLMELAATRFLQNRPNLELVSLHSINIDYLSSPSPKQVELVVEIFPYDDTPNSHMMIPVQVIMESNGRRNSQGLLHFTKHTSRL